MVEEVWLSHCIIVRAIGHFLPCPPARLADGIKFLHMCWAEELVVSNRQDLDTHI